MNVRNIGFFPLVLAFLVLGCAGSPKPKPSADEGLSLPISKAKSELSNLLSDERRLLEDSELDIIFPQQEGSSPKRIRLRSEGSRVMASSSFGREGAKQGALGVGDFRAIIAKLRPLEESQFDKGLPDNCRDPFTFKIRLATDRRTYVGCRGSGESASIISKTARDIEYLLIRNNAGHKGYSSPIN